MPTRTRADTGIYRIPGGEFHLNRCATLLNMYLMATYGEGQYVEAYYDQQIYLNHKLLEDKQLNLTEIQEKSAEFLVQFSGVNKVYSRPPAAAGLLVSADRAHTQRLSPQALRRPDHRSACRAGPSCRKTALTTAWYVLPTYLLPSFFLAKE